MRKEDITPALAKLMSNADKEHFGLKVKALPLIKSWKGRTSKLERDEHRTFEQWLRLHKFPYSHSRTDKPTRQNAGVPDFQVFEKLALSSMPQDFCKSILIDFKMEGKKLSEEQAEWARSCNGAVHVMHNAADAISLIIKHFGI